MPDRGIKHGDDEDGEDDQESAHVPFMLSASLRLRVEILLR